MQFWYTRGFKKIKPHQEKGIARFKYFFRKKRFLRLVIINFFSSFSLLVTTAGFFLIIGLFAWYSRDLPSPDKIKRREGFSTVIYDRQQKPVYDLYIDKNRIPISLDKVPLYLKQATIAIEDKGFYKHQGFDPRGILRSLVNILTLRGVQGGSTLTQQLVKNVLLTSERNIPRKIKEFILSVQIERKYSKDEILQMYLNEAPYGGTMWGIESAAKGYFGKSTEELSLSETVILAGLPQRPSYYSPFGTNPKAYLSRAEEVLRRMREDGYLTKVEELETKRTLTAVKFASESGHYIAPHFVFFVKDKLKKILGEKLVEEGGLKVYTTLDSLLQENAEKIIKEELEKIKDLKVGNGASLVIVPKTGEILSYVGSKEYDSEDEDFSGKFDVVSLGYRQPGSALKPITYAVALSKGYTASSLLMDAETHFPGGEGKADYIPKNYDDQFRGPVQIRFALANSINVPAVKMTALVGVKNILKTAFNMGLTTLEPTDENVRRLGLSLTLGGGEVRLYDLTSAFGVFAAQGQKIDPYAIAKVVDKNGKTLFEQKPIAGKRVISEDVAYLISNILADNNARKEIFGERSYLLIPGKTVAVKTGTTDDKHDNWTIGYTPSIVVGVWVGNNDNSAMHPRLASGTTGAAPIFNRIMADALKYRESEEFSRPDNIVSVQVDTFGGGLPKEGRPTRTELFIKGTEPTSISPIYRKIKLSKNDNNKLANLIEIATANYDEKEFIVFSENDPTSRDEKNRWQEGIDAWVTTQGDSSYHPPTEASNRDEDRVIIIIKKPQDLSQIDSNQVEIEAESQAMAEIKKMDIYIDDVLKDSSENNYFEKTYDLTSGIHKIKIRATSRDGKSSEKEVTIGVKVSAQASPTLILPSPSGTTIPSPT